jgi:hypothetical protein
MTPPASGAITGATVNTTMALRKTFLVPHRLTSQPLDGMSTARVTK